MFDLHGVGVEAIVGGRASHDLCGADLWRAGARGLRGGGAMCLTYVRCLLVRIGVCLFRNEGEPKGF